MKVSTLAHSFYFSILFILTPGLTAAQDVSFINGHVVELKCCAVHSKCCKCLNELLGLFGARVLRWYGGRLCSY
jgi:hypothetical protein